MASMGGFFAGSIFAKLLLDKTGWNQSIQSVGKDEKTLSGSADRITSGFTKMGMAMTVAGGAIIGILGSMVKGAAEEEDTLARLNAVIKSTGGIAGITAGEIRTMGEEFQKSTRFTHEETEAAGALLLTFTKIGKDIFPETLEAVLNMSAALGQDLKSSSIQLGKALQDPILGVTALRRVGVNFNEAAQEMIRNLVETGHAADAQKFILKELNTEFGGMAKAAGTTLSGQLKILKNQLGEVGDTLGTQLVPILRDAVGKILPVVQSIIDWAGENPALVKTILLASGAVGSLMLVVGPLLIALPRLVEGVGLVKGAFLGLNATVIASTAAITATVAAIGFLIVKYLDLQDATEKANEAEKRFNEKNIELSNKLYELVTAGKMTVDQYYKLWDQFNGNAAAMANFIREGNAGKVAQEGLVEIGKKHAASIEEQKEKFKQLNPILSTVVENQKSLKEEFGLTLKIDLEKKIKKYEEALKKYRGELPIKEEERLTKELREMSDEMATGGRVTDMLAQRFKNLKPKIIDLYPALDNLGVHAKAGCGAAGKAVAELSDGIKTETGKQEGYFDGMLSEVARNFGQTFQDMLTGHISFKDGLKQIWDSIKQTFFDMIGKMVTRWITGFLDQIFNKTKDTTGQVSGLFGGMSASMASAIGFVALQYGVFLDMMSHTPWDYMGDKVTEQIKMWQSWGLSIDEINKKLLAMIASMERAWALESGTGIGRGRRGGEEGEGGGRRPGEHTGGHGSEGEGFQQGGIAWREQIVRIAEKGPEIIWPLNKLDEILPAPVKEECNVDVHIKPLLIKRGDIVEIDFIVETMNKAVRRGEFTMPAFALKGA